MLRNARSHLPVLAVAAAALTVGLLAPAVGHGVEHALFAHNADKLDAKDSRAFLLSKKITVAHGGAGWAGGITPPPTISRQDSGVIAGPSGGMAMPLTAPTGFGSQQFGLSTLELCYHTSGDSVITAVQVKASQPGSPAELILDGSDRSTVSTDLVCDTLIVNEPVGWGASLHVLIAGTAGSVNLQGVRTTWTAAAAAVD